MAAKLALIQGLTYLEGSVEELPVEFLLLLGHLRVEQHLCLARKSDGHVALEAAKHEGLEDRVELRHNLVALFGG